MTTPPHLPRRARVAGLGLALTVLLAGAAAGCDDGDGASATSTTAPGFEAVDACALLTLDEVAPLIGGAAVAHPAAPIERDSVAVVACDYTREDGAPGTVSLILRREAGQAEQRDAALETLREETYTGRVVEAVDGLGDAALWVADGPARQLSVFDADDYLVITFPVDTPRDGAVALATTMLERVAGTR